LSSRDYLTNRDPVFEAILNYKETKPLADQLLGILNSNAGNHFEAMRAVLQEFKRKPEHKFYDTEKELGELGYKLLDMKKPHEATEILKLNAEFHPTSATAYRSLAEACEQNDEPAQAIENYKRALEFEGAENIRFWLKQKIKGDRQ